jgi:YesN/AraC family two-component response regulator
MPEGISGRDLVAQLEAKRPQLKFLLTSGYTFEHERDGDLIEGRNFLQKPYHPRLLARTIRESLDRKPAAKAAA